MAGESLQARENSWISRLTRGYERALQILFALVPAPAIAYLHYYQLPELCETHHGYHELAILAATLVGLFVTYVTWRCYLSSGEPFLRWLTLGFLGFTLIYAPHGLFTRFSPGHMWLFIIYGPVSRLAMLACLYAGLLRYGQPADPPERRNRHWGGWIAGFLGVDVLLVLLAGTSVAQGSLFRIGTESLALVFGVLGILVILKRHIRAPLMQAYAISLAIFAQSSVAFLLARPWNHQWWLAHAVFAGGFFFLSYWVIQAFHTTRAFSTVYSQEEIMERWRLAKEEAERALAQLEATHAELAQLAATDALTGAANRRAFMERAEAELARSTRSGLGSSVLLLDLDHFKGINDRFGHQAGDLVLVSTVAQAQAVLRPADLIGRLGGEEFMVLLPETGREEALGVGERIRAALEDLQLTSAGRPLQVTASIGVATFPADGKCLEDLFRVADQRLYQAKHEGRNRVAG